MRETERVDVYRKLNDHKVTADRNKAAAKCKNCCCYHPEFKYRKCLYATCPYGKPDSLVFRKKPLRRDKYIGREVVV